MKANLVSASFWLLLSIAMGSAGVAGAAGIWSGDLSQLCPGLLCRFDEEGELLTMLWMSYCQGRPAL